MEIKGLEAVILAAGKSERFKTGNTKLLEPICGQAMILYATRLTQEMGIPTTLIIGYQAEQIRTLVTKHLGNTITFATQAAPEGTLDALACVAPQLGQDHVLVMKGNTPLVTAETINKLYTQHKKKRAAISLATAHSTTLCSESYDRIITKGEQTYIADGKTHGIDQVEQCCVDAGIYIISREFLIEGLQDIARMETKEENRINELVAIASARHYPIATTTVPFDVVRRVRTLQDLWSVEQVKRAEIIRYWMQHGVRFYAAHNVHLDLDVRIGAGSVIGAGVHLLGTTTIGKRCTIEPYSIIHNSTLNDNVTVKSHTVVEQSSIEAHATVGPFAHVSAETTIKPHAVIGNFVETKRSTIGEHTNVKHLSYLGDAHVGNKVNVGAGVITCNYDGIAKHTTTIEDHASVGSNAALIAPVTIGKRSVVAAGSVITHDIPESALAIARTRQENKRDYAHTLRARAREKGTTATPQTNKMKKTTPENTP